MSFCPYCGATVETGDTFCGSCGKTISASATAGFNQPQNYQYSTPSPNYGATPNNSAPNQTYQSPYGYTASQQSYQTPSANSPYQSQYNPYNQVSGYGYANPGVNPAYQRMGGWLLFFMILCILDAAAGLIYTGIVNGLADLLDSNTLRLLDYYDSAFKNWHTAMTIICSLIVIASIIEIIFVVQVFNRKPGFLKLFQICRIMSIVLVIASIIAEASFYSSYDLPYKVSSDSIRNIISGFAGFFIMTLYYCRSKRVRTYMGSDDYIYSALVKFR